jgi:dynein heavy chain
MKTVNYFMDTVLSMQPRSAGSSAASPEQIVNDLSIMYRNMVPANLDTSKAHPLTFAETEPGVINSHGVFVKQEIMRFNKLLNVMKSSLVLLEKAIAGTYVMNLELESMFNKFLDGKVPDNWTGVAYPCLKPLGSWIKDLIKRIEFMGRWLYEGPPNCYWTPAFFFPQGFNTATMQSYARKNKVAIDTLAYKITVLQCFEDGIKEAPETGVYIYGLYMQGARWDTNKRVVDDSHIGTPIV